MKPVLYFTEELEVININSHYDPGELVRDILENYEKEIFCKIVMETYKPLHREGDLSEKLSTD